MENEYQHPQFGTGRVISVQPDGTQIIRFDNPPGMANTPGPHIVPTLIVPGKQEAING